MPTTTPMIPIASLQMRTANQGAKRGLEPVGQACDREIRRICGQRAEIADRARKGRPQYAKPAPGKFASTILHSVPEDQ
jgi:hypothetical protein